MIARIERIFVVLVLLVASSALAGPQYAAIPRVLVLTTGGTIAGTADPRSAIGYNSAQIGARELIAATPGIDAIAVISSERVAAIGSHNMTDEVLIALARRIDRAFSLDEADGVVVTHGTDTIEETAFFLDLVLSRDRPVVLVGAVRPSTAPGADGPANLYSAVQVAASPSAKDRGVLIVMNNTIHGARAIQKSNTSRLDGFSSPNSGPVGYVDAANARFIVPGVAPRQPPYALPASNVLPRVDIVYGYGQADDFAVEAAIARGARGIVLAGVGSGNAPASIVEALSRAAARGFVVVRSTRVGSGFVERNVENDDDKLGFVAALDLNPQKARILARLLIANGVTASEAVQRAFDAGFY